jgi:hypothetical protein
MAGSGGSGSSGGSGGGNKVAMLVGGGTLAGLIGWFVIYGGAGGSSDPTPTAVAVAPATATRSAPSGPATIPPASVAKPTRTPSTPSGVTLTITAYGLPARVSATFADEDNDVLDHGTRAPCTPDELYPDPCVYYWVVRKDAAVTISAGDALAGYWPALDSVSGPGCDITGNGRDQTCTLTVSADIELVAKFSGGESPGLAHYVYPTCPTQRDRAPAWASRCR